ncbi:Ig-like domain-containing protein [Sphingomonas sp. BN140010]|uniref:Ig-like domain-containing protein n=1 Tax=Sphingomonas arvum TaxID=2992113 RepID=A0ABT3JD31_9SPHN|nr:Ig-like domain-containing protein [Sphingomonas sp. BN140010]MCW3796978.1 Ig-like domain-containing protein [Sphingomonas sp. BN140010]
MPLKVRRDTAALLEDGSTAGNALTNDLGVSQVATIRFGTGPVENVVTGGSTVQGSYGYLTISPDGSYTYTATLADRLAAGAINVDTFTYSASGSGGTASNDLRFTITGVNDAPALTSASATLKGITEDDLQNGGQAVSTFLASSDPDNGALRGIAVTGLASGNGEWQFSTNAGANWTAVGAVSNASALLLRGSDLVRFVPNGITGTTATFTYRAWDQTSGTTGLKVDAGTTGEESAFSNTSATATINVASINDAPVAIASSASGTKNGPPVTGQLQATDVDSTTLTYSLVQNSAVGGSVTINSNGTYSYTPTVGFSGTGSFQFRASDGSLSSNPTTVTITVAGANDLPIAQADTASTTQGKSVLIDVLANDSDPNNDALTISALGSAAHGTVSVQNGQVLYTPEAGFGGQDSFIYTVSDGNGGTAQASVGVTVGGASTGPTAVSLSFRQGTNGYTGTVDTVLRQSKAGTAYPDAIKLHSVVETGKEFQPLLRFDNLFGTGQGQIPLGATIVSATLTLEVTEASANGGTINRMLANWSNNSTWTGMGNGVQIDGVEATANGAISVGAVGLGSRAFDVTTSLAAWNAAASTASGQNAANDGWLFKGGGLDWWDFTSAEGKVKPVLTVTYTTAGTTASSLPAVSIAAATAREDAGTISFKVTLSQASTQAVNVTLATVDHTALAGSDYLAANQAITFAPGETTKTFTVTLSNDAQSERPESFVVQILSATNATIAAPVAFGTIADNDTTVAPFTPITASIVATHNLSDGTKYQDGSNGTYGIGDPSAVAYVPNLGLLFIGDSEHDESPYNSPNNLFTIKPNGDYVGNFGLGSYTKEPTGLAYNSANGLLYIADDDKSEVFWTSPTKPSVPLGSFDTETLGFLDTEDLKFDPLTGHIYILDGSMKQIIELTVDGRFVDSIKLPSVMTDAEALAYDSRHDVFFVGSGMSANIWVLDHQGAILQTLTPFGGLSTRPKLKGFELAPSSNPNDGDTLSLYVADYGSDQRNDGRLFELHLGSDWFV